MPKTKKALSGVLLETKYWRKLLNSPKLLNLLVSTKERRNLAIRAAALEQIISGKSYRKICESLFLSPQTVSGIKKALKEKRYKSYLERSKIERKTKESTFPTYRVPRERGLSFRTKYGRVRIP
jgi:hypothetical protein